MAIKTKKQRHDGVPFTADDARVVQRIFDTLDGAYGDEARHYVQRYIKLKAQSYKLQKQGLKVRIVLPDFPGRSLLVIEK